MQVHREIDDFKGIRPVATVGIFDGVHLGHRYILDRLKSKAAGISGESMVVTLWPHPRIVLGGTNAGFGLLSTLEEKIGILENSGIDHLVVLPFTREFSRKASCEFIEEFLVNRLGIAHLVVGYNHRFGRDREGDFEKLSACAGKFDFSIEKMDSFHFGEQKISSSMIRQSLLNGDMLEVSKLLGRGYGFEGNVVTGSRLGTSIGFPTANITPESDAKLMPPDGVYAVRIKLKDAWYAGMMNIGTRPTVNDDLTKRTIEVHLIDFSENIYTAQVRIEFIEFLREEKKFSSIDALQSQLIKDKEETKHVFKDRISPKDQMM